MWEANETKVLRKILWKTKIDRMRSRQNRESCGIQPINGWAGRISGEWNVYVTRINAERLVKILRDNVPAG